MQNEDQRRRERNRGGEYRRKTHDPKPYCITLHPEPLTAVGGMFGGRVDVQVTAARFRHKRNSDAASGPNDVASQTEAALFVSYRTRKPSGFIYFRASALPPKHVEAPLAVPPT